MRKEDEEETDRPTDTHSKQAVEVLKALSHFEYPTEISQLQDWLEKTKPLQAIIRKLCELDKTGKMTMDCVNVLYEMIATHGEAVSPAVWNVLELVDEKDVKVISDGFLMDSTMRLKNALSALVNGVCQCGCRIPEIQTWCYALIDGLEDRQKYPVLMSVSRTVLSRLLHSLILPYTRKLTYPLFERLLYPMTYPHVFTSILDQIPEVLSVLENDKDEPIRHCFVGLMKDLVERFPPSSGKDENYENIKALLQKYPEGGETPRYPIWNPTPKTTTKISSILECPVCYDRFLNPIVICENGHCICSNCKDQLKNCPICRAEFSNIRVTIIDQIMEVTEFRCKNYDAGCDVKMLYKDIWSHELDCEYRTISCDIVPYENTPMLVCNEDVVPAYFHKHIEKCHKSLVMEFELNIERRTKLRRQRLNEVRLLKNTARNLYFIERIYVTDEEVFFSYHYVGKSTDAKNYVYTIEINGKGVPQKVRYRNFCLPNYMGIYATEVDERCLILEPEKIFDAQQTKFEYSVKIEDLNANRRLKVKKNKFMVSI